MPLSLSLDRYDDAVHAVLAAAQRLAREHQRSSVDTTAVLSALARHDDPRLQAALTRLGVPPAELAERAARRPAERAPEYQTQGEATPSAPVRRAVELALREALRTGQRSIGVGHLLLALLREPDAAVTELLVAAGATHERAGPVLNDEYRWVPFVPGGPRPARPPGPRPAGLVQRACLLRTEPAGLTLTLVTVRPAAEGVATETWTRRVPDLAAAVAALGEHGVGEPMTVLLDDVTLSLPALRRLAQGGQPPGRVTGT